MTDLIYIFYSDILLANVAYSDIKPAFAHFIVPISPLDLLESNKNIGNYDSYICIYFTIYY